MTTADPNWGVGRSSAVRGVVSACVACVALVAGGLGLATAALAQDAEGAVDPIVGAWVVELSPDDPADPPDLVTFGAGGTFLDMAPGGTYTGVWERLDDRRIGITALFPLGSPPPGILGFATLRAEVRLDADGATFAGTSTLEFPERAAAAFGVPVGELGPRAVKGERIEYEPMGSPIATLPPAS
jgi:hypothetical protein